MKLKGLMGQVSAGQQGKSPVLALLPGSTQTGYFYKTFFLLEVKFRLESTS